MRTQKNLFALFFVFLLLSCLLVAHADMGPKDQLTVRLVNPPQEPYYLDLLCSRSFRTASSSTPT